MRGTPTRDSLSALQGGEGGAHRVSDGRVRSVSASALESPTSPQPSPPPRAEREFGVAVDERNTGAGWWLLRRGCLRLAEFRVVGVVDKGFVAFGRHRLGVVERALDVLAPYLARQFVQHLDAVAVGVADVEAVGHAVIDPAVELDAVLAQPGELLQPGFAVRHRNRDVVDRDRQVEHRPVLGRLRQVRVLAERDVVVVHLAAVIAAVEAHRTAARLADLLEAEDLGPEFVRLFDVAHVDHQMVDAARGHRRRRGRGDDWSSAVRHLINLSNYLRYRCTIDPSFGPTLRARSWWTAVDNITSNPIGADSLPLPQCAADREIGPRARRRMCTVARQPNRRGRPARLRPGADAREATMFPAFAQHGELRPVVRVLVDLPMVELDRADRLRRRKEPAAFDAQPRVGCERPVLGEPGGNRRATGAVALARLDLVGRRLHCVAEVVERDRVEHDPERIRLVAQRGGRRGEHALARSAAPELNNLDLLAAGSFARYRGAAAMRAALGALFGVRDASRSGNSAGHKRKDFASLPQLARSCSGPAEALTYHRVADHSATLCLDHPFLR